jgi:RNA-directed DNA polymerase
MRAASPRLPADLRPIRAPSGPGADAKKHPPRFRRPRLPSFVPWSSAGRDLRVAKIKAHSLTGRITPDVLRLAFRNVKRNRGAAGIDKVSIGLFERHLDQNLLALMRRLKDWSFRPLPLRRSYISKGEGKTRPLGIPAVRDRIAQEVLRQLLSPLFERIFHADSYGFRPARNCHMAVSRVEELRQLGYTYVLDADIKGFFDNIPHAVIMAGVAAEVADGNILRLVERFLKAGVMEEGELRPTTVGTPQGGVISPLLANITLNGLDWRLHDAGYRFVRYADDFVVLCQSEIEVKAAHDLVQEHLSQLGLTLSAEKTKQTKFREGFAFLGFQLSSWSVKMRQKAVEKFKAKIRELTHRSHNLDQEVVRKVNAVIRGTANYFATSFSSVVTQFARLDHWMRMRLRCMKYKARRLTDNWRFQRKHLARMGFVFLSAARAPPVVGTTGAPNGAILMESPGA